MQMDVVAAICLIAAASLAAFLIGRLQGQKEGFEAGVGFMTHFFEDTGEGGDKA